MADVSMVTRGYSTTSDVSQFVGGDFPSKYFMEGGSTAFTHLVPSELLRAEATQLLPSSMGSEILSGEWHHQILEPGIQHSANLLPSELSYSSSTLTQIPIQSNGVWTSSTQALGPQHYHGVSDYAHRSPSFRADNFANAGDDKLPKSCQGSPKKEESLSSAHTFVERPNRKRRSRSIAATPTSSDKRRKKEKEETKAKADSENSGSSSLKSAKEKPPEPPKQDYIHVRARRGQATDSHSLAERVRREKISERMKFLQDLVPGCSKVTGKAVMLDEIINYVQSLQRQVEFLSMKLAAVNPRTDLDLECLVSKEDAFQRQLQHAQQVMQQLPVGQSSISPSQVWDGGDLQSVIQMFGTLANLPNFELEGRPDASQTVFTKT